jgi:hydrogenase-4 component B
MALLLAALIVLGASAFAALLAGRSGRTATVLGVGGVLAACTLAFVPVVQTLAGTAPAPIRVPWSVPGGSFYIQLDALSAFFLIPVLVLGAVAAVYGGAYLKAYRERKALGPAWFFYNLLLASMVLVLVARNGMLFLMAWEVMALTSFFLVTFEDEQAAVREAGWTYLVATHLGSAFLLAFFVLMGREAGTLDFDGFAGLKLAPALANLLFVLALIGFGTKAGFVPLHVWLPEAHPAAPSHVSAVMSGVMIKTGIYGLVRALLFLGPPPAWWGWALVGVGLSSGILGVVWALAQHDLKRLLAYHSVENIGIIALGLGVGVLGVSYDLPAVAALGFAGGLLHVLNHALFKGLLFLGAGAAVHATGTRELDALGGLLKKMPWTGAAFLIGSVAIAGLPPLNGFVSEFLIYSGAYQGSVAPGTYCALALFALIAGLALIGGLAAACFAKAFGIVFLGEPRTEQAAHAHEADPWMTRAQWVLAAGCVAIGLGSPWLLGILIPVVAPLAGPATATEPLRQAAAILESVTLVSVALLGLVAALTLLRLRLLSGRRVEATGTWDCGYAAPTARMEYTASSFAQPLTDLFHACLGTHKTPVVLQGPFPNPPHFESHTPDVCREGLFRPLFEGLAHALGRLRWLQHGRVQLYVLYIAVTLLALLVWKLG